MSIRETKYGARRWLSGDIMFLELILSMPHPLSAVFKCRVMLNRLNYSLSKSFPGTAVNKTQFSSLFEFHFEYSPR